MGERTPVFGGDGPIAAPPYSSETITSRIPTMRLEEMQQQIRKMIRWIDKAADVLERQSLTLTDDDGLQLFKLAKQGKTLIGK